MKLLALLLALAVIGIISIDQANGYCCKVDGKRGWPPACNIFGCNCDCLQCDSLKDKGCCAAEVGGVPCPSSRRKRHHHLFGDHDAANVTFTMIDTNGDGHINQHEAMNFLLTESPWTFEKVMVDADLWFTELDLDGDGKLQPKELDASMKQ